LGHICSEFYSRASYHGTLGQALEAGIEPALAPGPKLCVKNDVEPALEPAKILAPAVLFFSFQEYIYVGFQSLLQKQNGMDNLVDIISSLLYTHHDSASCCTLLSLVSSTSLSPTKLQKYTIFTS
jgi:hypothetical protein